MLKLLLGGSGSGKTTLLYQRIRARAEAGEKSILLVPEPPKSSFNMVNLSVGRFSIVGGLPSFFYHCTTKLQRHLFCGTIKKNHLRKRTPA